jgi:hypothetical protein
MTGRMPGGWTGGQRGRERPSGVRRQGTCRAWEGGRSVPLSSREEEKEEGLVGAVETVLWFPRSGGRVLFASTAPAASTGRCRYNGSGRSVENTRGRSRDTSARRGSVSRRRVRGARPVGNRADERQYRADDAQRLAVMIAEG